MNIDTLRIFCDVVRHQSFSQGAAVNNISQSAATQSVHRVEKHFGAQLVDRSKRPFVLTQEGQACYDGFREVLEKQAAVVLQPDISHAGGILETKKIAAMAECYYGAIAPHCPLGPIALASCLQLDASIPNFLIQEHVTTGEGYIKNPFEIKNGYMDLPTAPGLGIELDDDAIAEKVYPGDWETPRLWHPDGSVADW